jgi:ABC-type amino acid transport substrate-binding protein
MIATVVAEKIPAAHVNLCAGGAAGCIEELKAGRCALFVEDELQLRYRAIQDPALQLPGENFNTQYIVWAMRQDLPAETSALIKKWMFKTVADTTMDDFYYKVLYLDIVGYLRAPLTKVTLISHPERTPC